MRTIFGCACYCRRLAERVELLEMRDRITNVSVGFRYLVVATLGQICVYERGNTEWQTPHIIDLKVSTSTFQGASGPCTLYPTGACGYNRRCAQHICR